MPEVAPCGHPLDWKGLYKGYFDLWDSEAFSHPAKASPSLAFKILDHLKELGLLPDGSVILEPMTGIGTFQLASAVKGFASIGVELEEKFVQLATANAERLKGKGFNAPLTIIQGDSRKLSELLKERGLVALTSPPYVEQAVSLGNRKDKSASWIRNTTGQKHQNYGQTEGQIGNLPDKPLIGITSPPYAGGLGHGGTPTDLDKKNHLEGWVKDQYGNTKGQIENLPDKPLIGITSPPWAVQSGGLKGTGFDDKALLDRHKGGIAKGLGQTEGQIQNLPDRPLVSITSPPYEDMIGEQGGDSGNLRRVGISTRTARKYSSNPENIGNQPETYLSAMAQVYSEIAKVANVLVVVVKNPTRNGKLRRLDLDTIALLESCGWAIYCQHRAILFEEEETQDLFGVQRKKAKGRLSFFKRLSWNKGLEIAKHEDILVAVREGSGSVAITSPPYQDALPNGLTLFTLRRFDNAHPCLLPTGGCGP